MQIDHYEQKYGDRGFTGNWMYHLPFNDLDQISDWAFESFAWCYMNVIIIGKDGNIFDPKVPPDEVRWPRYSKST